MLYSRYELVYYQHRYDKRSPVQEYIEALPEKDRLKIRRFIQFLADRGGYLDEPHSKHIGGTPLRELIVSFGRSGHRVFYFLAVGRRIILLHAFRKKSQKTPPREIERGLKNYEDFIAYDQGTH